MLHCKQCTIIDDYCVSDYMWVILYLFSWLYILSYSLWMVKYDLWRWSNMALWMVKYDSQICWVFGQSDIQGCDFFLFPVRGYSCRCWMYACMNACMYECMHVWMRVCMNACMYEMHVSMQWYFMRVKNVCMYFVILYAYVFLV